ncbi:hypothetical protein SARC_13280, partial [Sphaeroforma arctica JP610]
VTDSELANDSVSAKPSQRKASRSSSKAVAANQISKKRYATMCDEESANEKLQNKKAKNEVHGDAEVSAVGPMVAYNSTRTLKMTMSRSQQAKSESSKEGIVDTKHGSQSKDSNGTVRQPPLANQKTLKRKATPVTETLKMPEDDLLSMSYK